MQAQRLVSVVIAVCRTDFFEAALRSILKQTHKAIEIVVCDDTTNGLAQTIVNLYQPSCAWPIRYFGNERSQGVQACFTRGVREAHGEYVKFLSDDAILEPHCVEDMINALNASVGARLVSSHRRWIDAQGQELPPNLTTRFRVASPMVMRGGDVVAFLGEYTCNFIGELSSTLCRRSDFLALGDDPFSLEGESLATLAELILYARLLSQGDLILLPDSLTATRIAPRNRTDTGIEIVGSDTESVHHFHRLIRQAGWSNTLLDSGRVGIKGLETRTGFREFNLLSHLADPVPARLNPQQVQAWLNARVLDATHQSQIDARLLATGIPSFLIVLLDEGNVPEKIQRTLNSLSPFLSTFASLQVVVISDSCALPRHDLGTCVSVCSDNDVDRATALNQIARSHDFEWLLVVEAGIEFTRYGLTACVLRLGTAETTLAAYADEMHLNDKGELSSALRPDFNLDYLLSFPLMTAGHWLFRRDVLLELGGFDSRFNDAAQFDLILRLIEQHGPRHIAHVCEPLLICDQPVATPNQHEINTLERHLRTRGYPNANVLHTLPRRYHVLYGHTEQPLVSIIIPTKDQLPLLQRCVETLLHITTYQNYELLIVDNNSGTPEALQWLAAADALDSERVRVLRYPFPFNYSRINNVAATHAKGDYLVLLNNDTAILHGRWLEELLNHALRPEVGIVGAKLLFPNGRLQHAGVRLGMDGPAGHQHLGEPLFIQGYMQRVQVDQNLNAVTAACLMIRRTIYKEAGGLDEDAFVVSYNDVDLCLKVRALGYLNVWTPHAVLLHEGSVSQKSVDTATALAKQKRFLGEQLEMYRKWLPQLAVDSAFNPNLSHDIPSVELELNMRLVLPSVVGPLHPKILVYPSTDGYSAQNRIVAPFETLKHSGTLSGVMSPQRLSIVEEARLSPDTIVFQANLMASQVQDLARVRLLPGTFVVLDLNDLQLGPDLAESAGVDVARLELLKQCLRVAHRVIASTQRLAEIAREFHHDVRWVPTRLPIETWGNLTSLRRQSTRPRVGLISDAWQPSDLQMILPVVQSLRDEVDWIVMGDHCGQLRDLSCESHETPPPEHYANAIAGLNLDLALLPAADNIDSGCKSNVGILQLGSCGVPLICSDVGAYQGELPVTCVPNIPTVWIELIRAHTRDLQSAALLGDALRHQVLSEWVLDAAAQQQLLQAWLPASATR